MRLAPGLEVYMTAQPAAEQSSNCTLRIAAQALTNAPGEVRERLNRAVSKTDIARDGLD